MINDPQDQEPIIIDQEPEVNEPEQTEESAEKTLATLPTGGLFSLEPKSLKEVQSIALVFAQSGMFEGVQGMAQAFVKIMQGRELGFTAVESMTGIHVIKGKPVVGAHLIAAGIRRSPQYDYDVEELDNERCTIVLFKNGKVFKRETFTIQDAKNAGLLNSNNWQKYPRNMLFARTISNIQKFHCPDVFNMPVYGPDEMGLDVDDQGNAIIEGEFEYVPETRPTPQPKQQQKRDSKPAPQPKTQPDQDENAILWQDHIKGWTQQQWAGYWIGMKNIGLDKQGRLAIDTAVTKVGLSQDEVHAALDVESVKKFAGTKPEHDALILAAVKAKIAGPTTQPGSDFSVPEESENDYFEGDEGIITCSRVTLTKQGDDQRPLITVYAIDESSGLEIEEPVMDRELTAAELEEITAIVPAKILKKGTEVYDNLKNKDDLLFFDWTRVPGKPAITITGMTQT